jgi:hypothetical protein
MKITEERCPMQEPSLVLMEFQYAMEHVEKLLDRRQTNTSFYLSVNAGILAVIGLLLSEFQSRQDWLPVSILLLAFAGLIACWIWRSLLHQYEILLDWWYARLRELESAMPDSARLVTREYDELYVAAKDERPSKRIGMTKRELALNWVFLGLYLAFVIGIMGFWLL